MNDCYNYLYDSNGLLSKMEFNNDIEKNYYDLAKRVIQYQYNNLKIKYLYDLNDNIVNKKYFITNISYNLSNSFNNDVIVYDDDEKNIIYKYNQDGFRTSKIVNNVKTKYFFEGNKLILEKTNNTVIYYLRNDVSNNVNHILNINPFRYRSYYYDNVTNLYYLKSRYYSQMFGRFINTDNYISTDIGFFGYNMYSYYRNKFVNYFDSDGHVILGLFLIGIAAVGAAFLVNSISKGNKVKKEIDKVQRKKKYF